MSAQERSAVKGLLQMNRSYVQIDEFLEKAPQLMLEETNKTMSALGLPAGMNLPGLG